MRRLSPETLHILDAHTNVCLCHTSDPFGLEKLRRELGRAVKIVPEWQFRQRRMALRLSQETESKPVQVKPLSDVLSIQRADGITEGDHLNFMTVRFDPAVH